MTKSSTRVERRGPDRPEVGDWKPCPNCAAGMLLFTEQYRGKHPPEPSAATLPAWVCDQCFGVLFVRAGQQPKAVGDARPTPHARAAGDPPKSRAVSSRTARVLKKNKPRS